MAATKVGQRGRDQVSLDNMNHYEVQFWCKGASDILLAAEKDGLWRCPECGHLMVHPPKDHNICHHCRKQFGYDAPEQEGTQVWSPA